MCCGRGGIGTTVGGSEPALIISTSPGSQPMPCGSRPVLFLMMITPLFVLTMFSNTCVYKRSLKFCKVRVSFTGGGPQKFVIVGIAGIRISEGSQIIVGKLRAPIV